MAPILLSSRVQMPGARPTAPKVGLQTLTTCQPDPPSTLDTTTTTSDTECDDTPLFDATIMHRVITPMLCDMHVQYDVSPIDIAHRFGVPVAYVAAHWITSRTPMTLPQAAVHMPKRPPPLSRFCSVDDNEEDQPPRPTRLCRRAPLSPAQMAANRDLAIALRRKLQPYITRAAPPIDVPRTTLSPCVASSPRPRPARPPPHPRMAAPPHPHAQLAPPPPHVQLAPPPPHVQLAPPHPQAQLAPPHTLVQAQAQQGAPCGWATTGTHADLSLSSERRAVAKRRKGLYRVARAAAPLPRARRVYAEVLIEEAGGEGGLCIGVGTTDVPSNRMIGSAPRSTGLHSTGRVVVDDVWSRAHCDYSTGDVVGICVDMPPQPLGLGDSPVSGTDEDEKEDHEEQKEAHVVWVTFYVNGRLCARAPLHAGGARDLYIMTSLYRQGSAVCLRCCARDWEFADAMSTLPAAGNEGNTGHVGSATCGNASDKDDNVHEHKSRATKVCANASDTCASVLTP